MRQALGNERGMAMVITLFVVALVTVLVLEYHFDATVELDLAANYGSDVQAYYLALAGVNFARALLQQDDPQSDGAEDTWHQLSLVPACFPPQQLLALASGGGGAPTASDQDETLTEASAGTEDESQNDTGCVSLRLVDEASKLPINALYPGSGENDAPNTTWITIFERFFESFEIDADIVDALVDWLDVNDNAQPGGAENSYYEGLETPYQVTNGPMHTPGELRLVRGFNAETIAKFFPGVAVAAMADVDLGNNAYLTFYGAESGATSGTGQTGAPASGAGCSTNVNVNTANAEVLQALIAGLQGGGADTIVDEIKAQREAGQFATFDALREIINDNALYEQLRQVAGVQSNCFRVESIGVVGAIRKKAVAVLKRDQRTVTPIYFKVE